MEASQLLVFCGEWRRVSFRGGRRGKGGESALELCVMLSSAFFLGGRGGESASGAAKGEGGRVSFRGCEVVCDVVVFCGEWRRVSFSSSAGNGGKSASGGAKGEGG